MTVLLVKPMHTPCRAEIGSSLEAMQNAVGGPIQAVYPFDEPVALICHEEGKLLNLPFNRALRHPETGEVYDIIAGTFFLCAAPPDSEEFVSLSEEQLAHYRRKFLYPEFMMEVSCNG